MLLLRAFILLFSLFFSSLHTFPSPLVSRESRALAPSVESWCIFYPDKCRMLRFAGTHKRESLKDFEY